MWITYALNFILLWAWLAATTIALLSLGRRPLAERERVLWALLIVLLPLLGALAFFLVLPGRRN